ncbi:MAG: hypothetical protein IPP31_12550 [Chitinophagaceae bacterium]|nr:hypothetical protein [Chitinophagaceae bacterium]
MKIEHLLVQHFYQQREITLQGLGSFSLAPDFIVPVENDKDIHLPENAIIFNYNPKAEEDPELISFIVKQTRKIRPLASADLDSYLVLGKQFLNIGKPFIIEGLGVLEKNQQGEYEFRQGLYHQSKPEAAPAQLKEKMDDDISFAAIRQKSTGNKKIWIFLGIIILIGVVASSIWYYLHNKKDKDEPTSAAAENSSVVTPVLDTTQLIPSAKDSLSRDSALLKPVSPYTFRVVFKETTNKELAMKKMNDLILRKHKVIMYTTDSVLFKLAEPFTLPLSDTARIRDSLNKYYYQNKAYIELN